MTVASIKERLAAIQRQVPGVARAYSYAPASIPPGDLPAFVNFTGASVPDFVSGGARYGYESRTYIMRLYVKPIGQGVESEAERLCDSFFETVRDVFASAPGFGLDTVDSQLSWIDAKYLGDQGVSKMVHGGEEFIGIEFRVQVNTVFERDYRKGD